MVQLVQGTRSHPGGHVPVECRTQTLHPVPPLPSSPGPPWLLFLTLQEEADGGSGHRLFKTQLGGVPVDHEEYLES